MINRRDALLALGATSLLPAMSAPQTASVVDLKGDIAIVRQALALHPGLYRYNSPAAMDARFAALERDFAGTTDRVTQYLILSRFLATIMCGHTYCNFFNQKKAVAADLFGRKTRLPFNFRWIDKRMIVTGEGGEELPRGTEVRSVNGVPARDMLARLMPYARADGHNDGKRVSLLEVHGNETIEFFDVFHSLVYGVPADGLHRLEVRLPDGTRESRAVAAIDLAARRARLAPSTDSVDGPIWDWTMRPDDVAVLTMPSWVLYNSSWAWENWLNDRLNSLKGAKGLLIELRDNEGGNDCGSMILARLATKRIERDSGERRVRFRTTPPALDPYLDTWDDSFRKLGVDATPLGNGFYRKPPIEGVDWIDPVGPRIDVPVAAMIGPVNSSATYQFAALAKGSGTVRLFGETTGGNRRGTIGGGFFFMRLPASGLEFDLPLIGYFATVPRPDGGLAPDVRVAPTIADIAAGRDPVADAAIAWIKRT